MSSTRQNKSLVNDYILRAKNRLVALEVLFQKEGWVDVVLESQKIVELSLKALLRSANIEVPRIHDVSNILIDNKNKFSKEIQDNLEKMSKISKALRRDRELSFYGSEDLTPSEFYTKEDAQKAKDDSGWLVSVVKTIKV